MASSVMKRACAQSLADAIRAAVSPTIDVQAVAADWEEPTKFPAVRILPGKFSFMPWQEREVDATQATKLFLEVGTFEGSCEVRVSAQSRTQRDLVQDAVLSYFLSRELSPGVQVTTLPGGLVVGGEATTYQATCAFALDDEEWRDEMAFSDKRYTFLDVDASFPALVVRKGVVAIAKLVLAMAADVAENVSASPPDPTSTRGKEDLLVADDGTTTHTNL